MAAGPPLAPVLPKLDWGRGGGGPFAQRDGTESPYGDGETPHASGPPAPATRRPSPWGRMTRASSAQEALGMWGWRGAILMGLVTALPGIPGSAEGQPRMH